MYTTNQASKLLNISKRRVTELIKDGKLTGEKISGIWLLDENSVDQRALNPEVKPGRPKIGKGKSEAEFVLHNREYPVLNLVYNSDLKTFTHIGETIDDNRLPIGIKSRNGEIKIWDFNSWWSGRGIPKTRLNLSKILEETGAEIPEELLFRNLGLSLSDQWWICPKDKQLSWDAINFFQNDFESFSYKNEILKGCHPNNTSDGNLEKFWAICEGKRKLYKLGSGLCQEPYNETVATNLHKRILEKKDFVPYELKSHGSLTYSVCENFLKDTEEFIPATWVSKMFVKKNHESEYTHYVNCCKELGVEGIEAFLSKMIICDWLLCNTDRHFRNFGIIRNVKTLECRSAPIFDSGNSLWFDVAEEDLKENSLSYTSKQFYKEPAKQLLLVDDFSIINKEKLKGFVDEAILILSKNPLLSTRLETYEILLNKRINKLISIVEFS